MQSQVLVLEGGMDAERDMGQVGGLAHSTYISVVAGHHFHAPCLLLDQSSSNSIGSAFAWRVTPDLHRV
jgi:hypothetical protein